MGNHGTQWRVDIRYAVGLYGMCMVVLETHVCGLKLSRCVDTSDPSMMVLRRTPVCDVTKFFTVIAIILSETNTTGFMFT